VHRFYLAPEQCRDPVLVLDEREAHHGLHVLRLRRGDRVVVLDGAGHEYLCEVKEAGRERLHLAVTQQNFLPPLPYEVTLVQAIPKGKIIESIIQKATELGVSRIVPLLSERVVAHLDAESSESRAAKWRLVAVEAIKQCGLAWLPRIELPLSPKAWLARGEAFDLPLLASLQSDSRHPREYFRAFHAERGCLPRTVCVWVGPEGDFTPAELSAAKSAGALPISLGRVILRSETAALYCLAVLNYELQSRYP
jgi:16S rRNA (uracil1498-N3)-methyltransferase